MAHHAWSVTFYGKEKEKLIQRRAFSAGCSLSLQEK
jgi:hypothetical protein